MKYTELKNAIKKEYSNIKGVNKKIIADIISAYKLGDYSMVHNSYLYKNNGTCYCVVLELLAAVNYNIQF